MSEQIKDNLKNLEKRISDLESKVVSSKPPKPPRKPSEYNIFMKEYMEKNKNDKKTHKELFGDAVKAWNSRK
jgi:hypothetical protein